jgi:hypothetical protein
VEIRDCDAVETSDTKTLSDALPCPVTFWYAVEHLLAGRGLGRGQCDADRCEGNLLAPAACPIAAAQWQQKARLIAICWVTLIHIRWLFNDIRLLFNDRTITI